MRAESKRLGAELSAAGADIALLSRPEDICYATGFEVPPPIDAGAAFAAGPTLAVVTREGYTHLLAPAAYAVRAEEMSEADEETLVSGFGHFESVDGAAELAKAVRDALAAVDFTPAATVAVHGASLPLEVAALLEGAQVVSLTPAARSARLLKTEREIEILREAVRAADAGQEALLELASPGRNELEVMGDVLTRVDLTARRPLPWAGELVTGPRTGVVRYPGGPIDRVIEEGDTALMDLSVRYRGYWADCCNVLAVGRDPSDEQLRYFRAARDAFEAAITELRPGRRACDAHSAAASAFARHGFEPAHYTGHQLGTAVNEDPRLVPYDETPIEAGMVFAVEPGVYGGPERTVGARTEKIVLVTEGDPEILSAFRWGMEG